MNGRIRKLLESTSIQDRMLVEDVFSEDFQTLDQWSEFLRMHLAQTVSDKLAMPAVTWNVRSFQALFIACWIHHPVEKGSYMIDLSGLSPHQLAEVKSAYKSECQKRAGSSHLSESGRSAHEGWNFLNGYRELLVQFELTGGMPFLFLKAEGHPMKGLASTAKHLASWVEKNATGAGKQASEDLNYLARTNKHVELRAAENYDKGYEKLLKDVLGLKGKTVTVREMIPVLFETAHHDDAVADHAEFANNAQLGQALQGFCVAARTGGGLGPNGMLTEGKLSERMLSDLQNLSQSLISDGEIYRGRVYREVRASPAEFDASLNYFYCGYEVV